MQTITSSSRKRNRLQRSTLFSRKQRDQEDPTLKRESGSMDILNSEEPKIDDVATTSPREDLNENVPGEHSDANERVRVQATLSQLRSEARSPLHPWDEHQEDPITAKANDKNNPATKNPTRSLTIIKKKEKRKNKSNDGYKTRRPDARIPNTVKQEPQVEDENAHEKNTSVQPPPAMWSRPRPQTQGAARPKRMRPEKLSLLSPHQSAPPFSERNSNTIKDLIYFKDKRGKGRPLLDASSDVEPLSLYVGKSRPGTAHAGCMRKVMRNKPYISYSGHQSDCISPIRTPKFSRSLASNISAVPKAIHAAKRPQTAPSDGRFSYKDAKTNVSWEQETLMKRRMPKLFRDMPSFKAAHSGILL